LSDDDLLVANIQGHEPSPPTSLELEEGQIDELEEEKEDESHHQTEAIGNSLKGPVQKLGPELEEGEIDEEEKEDGHSGAVEISLKECEVPPIQHDLPADTDDDIYV